MGGAHKKGFSKLSKKDKTHWIQKEYLKDGDNLFNKLQAFQHPDSKVQKILDDFSENTLCNFPMPFGVAPNFTINGKTYCVPLVIEESSVVAAASSAAKFWSKRGGIQAEVISTVKLGHVHLYWQGEGDKLQAFFDIIKEELIVECKDITSKMTERGGGILEMNLINLTDKDDDYYQIEIKFETCDSMGANFINSVLERVAALFKFKLSQSPSFQGQEKEVNIIMSILSNYTPECIVRTEVSCPVEKLANSKTKMPASELAQKLEKAVKIASINPYRATTHNKGIFNGIDAVVLATGNDFRAIEACGHTYAARDGQYRSLTNCIVKNDTFKFWMDIPLALGTVGGLTKLHPLAELSLRILDNPSAQDLMKIVASVGLMQNFGALRSLVTTGIQKGHMKMHLSNILNQFHATEKEFAAAVEHFGNKIVSFSNVREYLDKMRSSILDKNHIRD